MMSKTEKFRIAFLTDGFVSENEAEVFVSGRPTAGSVNFRRCRELGGPGFDRAVMYLGKMRKGDLYSIVRGATATVAPSVVDNLPNTVIESLMFGVPVIGTDGASIDELVEHGRSGELLPAGNAIAFADAIVRVWRNEVPWGGRGFQRPAILDDMTPDKAVANLIRLAGCRPDGP